MAVKNELFLFEVVIEKINAFVESRLLVIKGDFANIFSLEMKDPKSMHIIIPDPPPPPPEPVGKKKKKPPKPKKKKGKGGPPPVPPEPEILAGQSVLFTTSAEVLVQNMKNSPLLVSLWSKEENLKFIGSSIVPWDNAFCKYLENIYSCVNSTPPIVKDEYNVFEERTGKLIAKMTMRVKLTYLTDRIVTSFRTITEDPTVKKVLYTGMNSKTTSYMCTLKTTDEDYEKNIAKIPTKYTKDTAPKPMVYADYKNVPGAALPLSAEGDYCCKGIGDKPPDNKYVGLEVYPDIDFICDYVRKIISSCNDNMRMLTPRPTIKPKIKATDIDKLCYCRQTAWPKGDLAERFRKETQGGPCPICIKNLDGKARPGTAGATSRTLDIANIRGPCGRPDCRIARDIRGYLEKLVEEDNKEINLEDIVGPCGSKECTLVDKIKDFLQHRGKFKHGASIPGLSTQCACLDQMQNALIRTGSCTSICSHECESDSDNCGGKGCPYRNKSLIIEQPSLKSGAIDAVRDKKPDAAPDKKPVAENDKKPDTDKKVYYVYYFTVEYTNKQTPPASPGKPGQGTSTPASAATTPGQSAVPSKASSPSQATAQSNATSTVPSKTTASVAQSSVSKGSRSTSPSDSATASSHTDDKRRTKFKYCAPTCPTAFSHSEVCSKTVCGIEQKIKSKHSVSCTNIKCPTREAEKQSPLTPSPADSDVELRFSDIRNPCCVKSCDVSEKVKDMIMEGLDKKAKQLSKMDDQKDPCFCDCVCDFPMSGQTTYCTICGGYEFLGDAVRKQPGYLQPHPCPVYHKLYETKNPDPATTSAADEKAGDSTAKSGKSSPGKPLRATQSGIKTGAADDQGAKQVQKKTKKKGKDDNLPPQGAPASHGKYHKFCHHYIDAVPKHMGWLWNAEDIPGLKFRPKWRPGAANKILVRRYRTVREGVDIILKKKRALMNRKKKIEMKPTLVVTKKDGEYIVQMEVFKKYSKERLRYQYPYDEKPPLIYTIGKTEETKAKVQRQRERRERRESRRKSRMLQSTFRDKCQEICLKAYNQSIGLLPMSNANNPECPCDIRQVKTPSPVIDSCSCSETGTVSSSDTDGDDWVIEFTPPLATWDAKAKHAPVTVDSESQYNYLDYKVKCLDKQGNQVPRFFKGPDGKQECSDLGGFYGPGNTWLEINKDGYIGPDNRWVPQNFIGPDGMYYLSEDGFFTDNTGRTWKIGIDGYVDKDGKWEWYAGKKRLDKEPSIVTGATADAKNVKTTEAKDARKPGARRAHALCRTDTPRPEFKRPARVTKTENDTSKRVKGQESHHAEGKNQVVVNVAMNFNRRQQIQTQKHQEKTVINQHEMEKLARYHEIMDGLQMYEDIARVRPPMKTNRAVETRQGLRNGVSKYSVYDSKGLVSSSKITRTPQR